MQVIHQIKNEESISRRTSVMCFNICVGRISRYLKEECFGRFGD